MCLGESTTLLSLSLSGHESAYPFQLEKILNQSNTGIEFKVINNGMAGINTSIILANLEEDLNKYKPDMVISMLGINDPQAYMFYEDDVFSRIVYFFKSFRIYKLAKILWENIVIKAKGPRFYKENDDKSKESYCEQLSSIRYNEKELKEILDLNPRNDTAYVELGRFYLRQRKLSLAEKAFKNAISLNPKNVMAFNSLINLYQITGKQRATKEYIKELNINRLTLKYYMPLTCYNYEEIKRILDKRGIKLVCVQYPLRSVWPLKKIFEGQEKDIIFVDNEEVFRDALMKTGYKEYFIDMFAGDFGHCTPKGDKLLATNIAKAILKECFNK